MSSSSSECDNYEFSPYEFILNKCRQTPLPFGTSMGHPLIYFSEVNSQPQPLKQKPRNDRRERHNSFTKAFKWYLKDHGSNKKTLNDMRGFASWLDNKYSEYLRETESQAIENPQYAVTADSGSPSSKTSSPIKTKRFSRLRSPWSNRRRESKDSSAKVGAGETSCQFIMQPKEMERPTSEYCSLTCCNKSKTILKSARSPKKNSKSQSLTCVCTSDMNSLDVTRQEGTNGKALDSRSVILRCEAECQYSCANLPGIQGVPKGVKVICKCPVPSKDKKSQLQNTNTGRNAKSSPEKPSKKKKNRPSKVVCQCPKANIIESGTARDDSCHNHHARDRIQTSSGGVQTSDHSINLDEEIVAASKRKRIYVRLVYADQLKVNQESVLQH